MERNYRNIQNQTVGGESTQQPSGSASTRWIGASVGSQCIDATVSASSGGLVAAALAHLSAISLESIEYEDQKRNERFMHYLNEPQALEEDNEQSSEDEIDNPSEYEDEETERFTISYKEPGPLAVSADDYDP